MKQVLYWLLLIGLLVAVLVVIVLIGNVERFFAGKLGKLLDAWNDRRNAGKSWD